MLSRLAESCCLPNCQQEDRSLVPALRALQVGELPEGLGLQVDGQHPAQAR